MLSAKSAEGFLDRLADLARTPAADGLAVFDRVAAAVRDALPADYVGLALAAPAKADTISLRFRHHGDARAARTAERIFRERMREWRRSGDARHWRRTGESDVWEGWPVIPDRSGGRTAAGGIAVHLVDPACLEPDFARRWRPLLDLAVSLFVRSMTIQELRALHADLMDENEYLREEIRLRYRPEHVVWVSGAMEELVNMAVRLAPTRATVLIEGETGTGKELIAHLIHEHSPRAGAPFIRVNCAALPESLLESELFGHVRGAFTGATRDRKGRFEAADGGTIFLDEIGDVSRKLQVRLLRVLQEREIERVGEHTPRRIDVRVIAATNRDLEEEVERGRFRQDLYYRLNVAYLRIPPLRERPEDILPLAEYFLDRYNRENLKSVERFSPEAIEMLRNYQWPGNVRELQNCIEKAVILAPGPEITPDLLPSAVAAATRDTPRGDADLKAFVRQLLDGVPDASQKGLYRETKDQFDRALFSLVLERTGGNQLAASRLLGINRNTLHKRLIELGLRHQGASD